MSVRTLLATLFTPDSPIVAAADWFLDKADRLYIDDQIRALQQNLVYSLRGQITTQVLLHSSSATGNVGDCVCAAAIAADESDPLLAMRYVTRATTTPIAASGLVVGVLVTPAAPGGWGRIAVDGIIGPSVTGLAGLGVAGPVRLNVTTGRCERVASFVSGDYPIGYVDAAGNLSLGRGRVIP